MSSKDSMSNFSNFNQPKSSTSADQNLKTSSHSSTNAYSSNNRASVESDFNYSSEVDSLFNKLQQNILSNDQTVAQSSAPSTAESSKDSSNLTSTSSSKDYVSQISDASSRADGFVQQISSLSSKMVQSSARVSSITSDVNRLNHRVGLNELTIPDNEAINNAAQAIAINIIKANNQKVKALTASNNVADVLFRIKFDYHNYLKAKQDADDQVTGLNSLNSHNSLIASYANQLSLDINNASSGAYQASSAAASAFNNRVATSSAYNTVHSLADRLSGHVASGARSNADVANVIASEATDLTSSATDYEQTVNKISSRYPSNASIISASSTVSSNLQMINSNQSLLSNIASTNAYEVERTMDDHNLVSLGRYYQDASKAVKNVHMYKNTIVSAMSNVSSATSVSRSVAASLRAKRIALTNGANDYLPVSSFKSLDSNRHTAAYIKCYKQGYYKAQQGFHEYIHQTLSSDQEAVLNDNDSLRRIGSKHAKEFISGVNDARKRTFRNDHAIDSKNYNYGYDSCKKLIRHSSFNKDNNAIISLNQALLLVIGFLIGSYR